MIAHRWGVAPAILAALTTWATATAVAQVPPVVPGLVPAASPAATASAARSAEGPIVWLRGPFGTVAGGTRDDPATAPPQGIPLDMVNRRMPLLLELEDVELLPEVRVTAEPIGPGQPETLAQGQIAFEGPSMPGRSLIVASIELPDAVAERAWLVDVPDREPPADGLLDIPAPRIIVATTSGRRAGEMADGCYAFLCVETGPPPPARTLEALPIQLGETPLLSIEDGSALVAWQGQLTPLADTQGVSQEASGAITDLPIAEVPLTGLEPAAQGEWLLEVRVEFDRERGWTWTAYRLVVE